MAIFVDEHDAGRLKGGADGGEVGRGDCRHALHRLGEATKAEAVRDRAKARYPAALPAFMPWAEARHPQGPFEPFGECASLTRQAMADLERHLAGMVGDADSRLNHPETLRRQLAIFDAGDADKRNYYAPLRPAYDALQAERQAVIAAIDVEEGIAALRAADDVAYERRAAAHEALMGWRPVSWLDHAAKASAILRHPWNPDQIDESEADQIAADIDLLTGGAA